jgi:polyphosphate kinase 2
MAGRLSKKVYEAELTRMQAEVVDLQAAVRHTGMRVAVVFEGRDTAGKGGTIRRITAELNPRSYRVAALSAPSEREAAQWYFQRYIEHMPAAGEIVFFDRSWYNRAGVERVMGFCTEDQANDFLRAVPDLERMLVSDGLILVKYWLEVSAEAQEKRFQERATDPTKRWKLSPIDLQARKKYADYTRARDEMLERTDIPQAPWFIVDADDQRRARLNCFQHLLDHIPQRRREKKVALPKRPNMPRHTEPPAEIARVPARW